MMGSRVQDFRRLFGVSLLILLFSTRASYGQTIEEIELDLDEVEKALDVEEEEPEIIEENLAPVRPNLKELTNLSDLAKLAPFSDIAVIQRKFFPKSKRYELFAGGLSQMNDSFFTNLGGALRAAYYLTDKWGVEAMVHFFANIERGATKDLAEQGIVTQTLVFPKSYLGVDLKWSPIYGKMAFKDQRIVPYDMYFAIGGGLTQTNQSGQGTSSAPTIHLGTGQIFAVNKWIAFRWDFSWNFYRADVDDGSGSVSSGTFDNLFIMLGMSFFLGESFKK